MFGIGHVRFEQLNQNKDCHEWEVISLSEIDTIKALIKNRVELDKFYEAKEYETQNIFESNGVPVFHEIIEVTYLDLEQLILKSRLTEQQLKIIDYLMHGYDFDYVAIKFGCNSSNIAQIFDTACKKIKDQNDFEWYEWLETSGKIRVEGEYKQCTKCKRWLKATLDNFSPNEKGQFGLYSLCKDCR